MGLLCMATGVRRMGLTCPYVREGLEVCILVSPPLQKRRRPS